MNQLTISGNVGGNKGKIKMKINNIENLALRSLMDKYDACPESLCWLGDRDLATALAECPNINWIFWLAAHMLERKQFVLLVVAVVQPAMEFMSDGEDRPQACLDLLTAWANGEATLDDVLIAANAAADAANAATAAAANAAAHADYAAYTATYAAAAAANATVHAANAADGDDHAAAAYAAVHAAYAAAAAGDYANDVAAANYVRIEMRNIIRSHIQIE